MGVTLRRGLATEPFESLAGRVESIRENTLEIHCTFDDMVDYTDKNGNTFKITRKERSERQSGTLHWKKLVTNRRVEVEKPRGRCLDLLYKLDQEARR